jgi:hypothetical protein
MDHRSVGRLEARVVLQRRLLALLLCSSPPGARAQLVAVDHVGHSFVGHGRADTCRAALLALDGTQSFIAAVPAP